MGTADVSIAAVQALRTDSMPQSREQGASKGMLVDLLLSWIKQYLLQLAVLISQSVIPSHI